MATIDRRGASLSAADPPIATNPNPDLAIKAPVRVATTGSNLILSGLQTIDGVALAAGDRVLVKDQTDATTNGIYTASTGVWTRAIDNLNNSQLAQGTQILVTQGAAFTNTLFSLTTISPILLGTSAIMFASVNVPAVRKVNTAAPLAGGGSLAADLTLTFTYGATFAIVANAFQTVAMTGDVATAANSFVTTIQPGVVTYAKIQNAAASRLLGNPTGGAASPSEISLGATLAFSGAALQTGAGTGDVAWVANAYATTIQAGVVSNSKLANMGAWSFKGNATGGSAAPTDVTIQGLTLKPVPAGTDLTFIWDVAASQWKNATVSSFAASAGVSSIATNTGAFTLSGLLTNNVNVLQVVAAVKSDQQTGTSATLAVTPAHQQDHDSADKAWVAFTGSNGAIQASFNITSVTRNSAGIYTVVFTAPFAAATYACTVNTEAGGFIAQIQSGSRTTSQCVAQVLNSSFTAADPTSVFMTFKGRQ